jgi:hypothetical protein
VIPLSPTEHDELNTQDFPIDVFEETAKSPASDSADPILEVPWIEMVATHAIPPTDSELTWEIP